MALRGLANAPRTSAALVLLVIARVSCTCPSGFNSTCMSCGWVDGTAADAMAKREIQLEANLAKTGGMSETVEGDVPVIDLAQPEEVCAAAVWDAATLIVSSASENG